MWGTRASPTHSTCWPTHVSLKRPTEVKALSLTTDKPGLQHEKQPYGYDTAKGAWENGIEHLVLSEPYNPRIANIT